MVTAHKPDGEALRGFSVVAFESRMALPMQRLIEKYGGTALVAPSMQEVPLQNNLPAFDFYRDLKNGCVDLLILMTGVATRTLIQTLETKFPRDEIITTLATKTKIVVRGPKPTKVCNMAKIPIAVTAPEPNTWREILEILQDRQMLAQKKVAILEYGVSNMDFMAELKAHGAEVRPVKVYSWSLPDDVGPLNRAIDSLVAGKVDMALFTTQVQVDHLLMVAGKRNLEAKLRRALTRIAIGSIGPTTSENLRQQQFFPDFEATPNKLDQLVAQAATAGPKIIKAKQKRAVESWVLFENPVPLKKQTSAESIIMRALQFKKNGRVPIWLMRQAGRYMAEYQLIRQKVGFLEFCKNPDLCTGATITAVERLGVDAAIIFSDILLILEPMGLKLSYNDGIGPVIANPVRGPDAIAALKPVHPEDDLSFVLKAITQTRESMDSRIPLIGFCGAPFTVASYMIEGRSSRQFIPTKGLMHADPKTWHKLMAMLVDVHAKYLKAQVAAGAQILQIFDSWVGCLAAADFAEYILPHVKKLFEELGNNVPTIYFGSFTQEMLPFLRQIRATCIGMDWKTPMDQAWKLLGKDKGLQGNLDPALLFSAPEFFLPEAKKILATVGNKPGFIFNLGSGILPETPVDHVMALVDYVHEWKGE